MARLTARAETRDRQPTDCSCEIGGRQTAFDAEHRQNLRQGTSHQLAGEPQDRRYEKGSPQNDEKARNKSPDRQTANGVLSRENISLSGTALDSDGPFALLGAVGNQTLGSPNDFDGADACRLQGRNPCRDQR